MVKLRKKELDTLLAVKELGGKAKVTRIMEETGLPHATIMRSSLTLKEKHFVNTVEEEKTIITLNEEGKTHSERGLPERRVVNALAKLNGRASIKEVVEEARLDHRFVPIALGWLKRKGWATIESETNILRLIEREEGKDERLLKLLREEGELIAEELSSDLRPVVEVLERRQLLKTDKKTTRIIELTEAGLENLKEGIEVASEVTQLTPELIVSGKWRKTELAEFDVTAPGPKVYPAKLHPVQQVIKRVKEIFTEMGFKEIRGPIIETAFWNFDSLFQPQDHPAREMHDTFYLEQPKTGKLPDQSLVERVAKTHEDGWKTGSRGWEYSWSEEEAKRLIFRTHTTATTIRYLSENKEPPVKVFSVDRVYRNEKMDYHHIAEFHQVEGIIMEEGVTLQDLIGTLKEFYYKLGLKKVKFWPSYFPYTEPSAQSTVYIPEVKEWVELGGMGMFRPEVLAPLGIDHPVLAWGLGLERLIVLKLGLEDIRLPYKNDLNWIRRTPSCQ
ncbi:MAG: phenylalanine--tRNA ligase subunit alpha [Thermoproteota archaeon]